MIIKDAKHAQDRIDPPTDSNKAGVTLCPKAPQGETVCAELHLRLTYQGQTSLMAHGEECSLVPVLEQKADLLQATQRNKHF